MPTIPRLTSRYERFVELVLRDRSDLGGYRLSAANTLDTAFSGATTMFTVARNSSYRSKNIRKRGLGRTQYETRGLTWVFYDPEDFWVGGGTLPHDADTGYLRVEEQNLDGTFRPAGPILVVPHPSFFTTTRPSLIVNGTAPNVAATATGVPPTGALNFVLPRFADSVTLRNTGAATLFLAVDPGQTEIPIAAGTTLTLPDGAVSQLFVRGNGAISAFTAYFAVVNAEMA